MVEQAMLFLNFIDDRIEVFKREFHEAARQFSTNNLSFLIGDVEAADRAFQVLLFVLSAFTLLEACD
jgi:protein disulfide-isomerase A1